MDCIKCFKPLPDFIIKYYLDRKQRCPNCLTFCPVKNSEDSFRKDQERIREHSEIDRKEKVS